MPHLIHMILWMRTQHMQLGIELNVQLTMIHDSDGALVGSRRVLSRSALRAMGNIRG